jgi:hypothetical protein
LDARRERQVVQNRHLKNGSDTTKAGET